MKTLEEEKQFYERFWALLSDKDLMRVFARYGPSAFRRSSVLEGLEPFIKETHFRGRHCIEIGTLKGLTALVLARYFERVTTFDVVDDPLVGEISDMIGLKNVDYIVIENNEQKAAVMRTMQFDAAYLDGDHTNDTITDFELVSRCGRVMFHEFWEPQPPVVALVGRLRPRAVTKGKFALWTA